MSHPTASRWQERLASPILLHSIPVVILALVVAGLALRLAVEWRALEEGQAHNLAARNSAFVSASRSMDSLRGVDGRLADTRAQIDAFYGERIAGHYSSVAIRLVEIERASGAKLSRVQFTQGKPGTYLTEISIDSGISGQYSEIMRFVNGLERDQTFFVIRGMTLSGQDGGLVNLRMLVSTWLRPAEAAASGIPMRPEPGKLMPDEQRGRKDGN